ncbi:MAG: enoyl-CoA hydratase/isomerase family protein [Holosporales bacterium]
MVMHHTLSAHGVLTDVRNGVGFITLDRPKTLNALTLDMIMGLTDLLKQWAQDPQVETVIVQSSSARAFCAGGDIKGLYYAKQRVDRNFFVQMFFHEYRFNYFVYTFPKPLISLVQGFCMGGGLGLAVHCRYRVGFEEALFAMPEANIGYFTDVGAGRFFNHGPNRVGYYLAASAAHVPVGDGYAAGLVTHTLKDAERDRLVAEIMALPLKDHGRIKDLLDNFASAPPPATLEPHYGEINSLFAPSTWREMVENVRRHHGPIAQRLHHDWQRLSPLSVAVSLEYLARMRHKTLKEVLIQDYHLSQSFLEDHDFFEGVRATLIDRDRNPRWNPQSFDDIRDEVVASYFSHKPLPYLFMGLS